MMILRMYMMLTFFTVAFLYINLKIVKNGFVVDRKSQVLLIFIPILGFLTQYFFAIYAFFVFSVMIVMFIGKKKYKEMLKYIRSIVIAAVLAILIFPFAIGHMLWSDRSVGSFKDDNILVRVLKYFKLILVYFGSKWPMIIAFLALAILMIMIKRKKEREVFSLIIFPTLLFIVVISFLTEFIELRYVMNILPIVAIMIIVIVGSIFESPKYDFMIAAVAVVVLLGYGLITERPLYLYKGYHNYVEIAEKYKDDDLVYVGYTFFNHMQSMPEFMKYKRSFMVYNDQLNELANTDELDDKSEFILSVNEGMEPEKVLGEVMSITGFDGYELIYGGCPEIEQVLYRVYRK